ncbi:N-acetylneuraminate synthase [Pontibacter ummariensis]|uniref:N-acetylneuraminate synthase n=1 Tax=Pontibacter ummariensis TaxID=1610492 RepID=A0A239ELH4_9BACT|nr:N-acetylneuraminate synthase [Pontibacter ummariensis]PRY13292.1 N-acetylneuraminate synthase [Pontibacter ummariensis]SNS44762.1 N-acetylneuraminate synthase [Pontibacter ummariensis]
MSKTIIIAEAGVNHNGDMALAKQLINVAADAGADYVKFQTFKADKLVSKAAKQAAYQVKNQSGQGDDTQYSMLKKLELSEEDHYELQQHADQKGIKFLSTGFDHDSIDFLDKLGLNLFKIPSGEITNKPYLKHVARKGKPVVLSTGMASLKEVEEAMDVLEEAGLQRDQITVVHCNTEYPTPMADVNLKAMLTIRDAFKVKVGYSDHTLGIEVPIAAVTLGATVIEKHFTLDHDLPGPDHKASLGPAELKAMVQAIRNIELALSGDGRKRPSPSELQNKPLVRKSLYYKEAYPAGTVLEESHFIAKRPATGFSPMRIDDLLGKTLKREVKEGELVEHTDFS